MSQRCLGSLLRTACCARQPAGMHCIRGACIAEQQVPDPGRTPQVYDFIDRHITKLDKDCKAFDAGGCTA